MGAIASLDVAWDVSPSPGRSREDGFDATIPIRQESVRDDEGSRWTYVVELLKKSGSRVER